MVSGQGEKSVLGLHGEVDVRWSDADMGRGTACIGFRAQPTEAYRLSSNLGKPACLKDICLKGL